MKPLISHNYGTLHLIIIYVDSAAKLSVWDDLWFEPRGEEGCDHCKDDDINNDKQAHN